MCLHTTRLHCKACGHEFPGKAVRCGQPNCEMVYSDDRVDVDSAECGECRNAAAGAIRNAAAEDKRAKARDYHREHKPRINELTRENKAKQRDRKLEELREQLRGATDPARQAQLAKSIKHRERMRDAKARSREKKEAARPTRDAAAAMLDLASGGPGEEPESPDDEDEEQEEREPTPERNERKRRRDRDDLWK